MKRLALCLSFAAACATAPKNSAPVTPAASGKTLYERLGGMPAITAAVEDFRNRVASDPRIANYFAKVDMKHLTAMLIEQLCEATGGPCHYSGKDMRTAHQGLNIRDQDFDAMADDMVQTLDKLKIPTKEKNELMAALGGMKGEVVGQ